MKPSLSCWNSSSSKTTLFSAQLTPTYGLPEELLKVPATNFVGNFYCDIHLGTYIGRLIKYDFA
ncbi:hypothetical protein EMGBS3_10900 [Anaerolineaceae bacterium]|nr:hypothetical protein EMGBS3_10900 [Anaerolineaceae bacterium]